MRLLILNENQEIRQTHHYAKHHNRRKKGEGRKNGTGSGVGGDWEREGDVQRVRKLNRGV